MLFKAMTETEIAASRLWPAGEYDFEVLDGIEKPSSKGNQMIQLKIKLFGAAGATITIPDYLHAKRMDKLLHASRAMGLEAQYQKESLTGSDFKGKRGRLKLGIEKGKQGYSDKNFVVDYLCTGTALIVRPPANDNAVALILAKYRK